MSVCGKIYWICSLVSWQRWVYPGLLTGQLARRHRLHSAQLSLQLQTGEIFLFGYSTGLRREEIMSALPLTRPHVSWEEKGETVTIYSFSYSLKAFKLRTVCWCVHVCLQACRLCRCVVGVICFYTNQPVVNVWEEISFVHCNIYKFVNDWFNQLRYAGTIVLFGALCSTENSLQSNCPFSFRFQTALKFNSLSFDSQ